MPAISQATLRNCAKPTQAQAEAGNYRMGHVRIHGMDISIETPKGKRRRPEWPPMAAHYGYFKRSRGNDGDHVDVFIGPDLESYLVVVIDQVKADGSFDEHKVMLAFATPRDAIETYKQCYTKGWKVGRVTIMTIPQFKSWLNAGSQKKPIADQVSKYSAEATVTGKHGDKGRYVTTDDGNQIFLTSSGQINRTGKPIGGGKQVPQKRNRPSAIPKKTMEHPGGGIGIDLEGRLPLQQQGKKETDWDQRLKQLQQRRGDSGIPEFAELIPQSPLWQDSKPSHSAAVNPSAESHPLHHSHLPAALQRTVLVLHADMVEAIQRVAAAGQTAKMFGSDPARAKRDEFKRVDKQRLQTLLESVKAAVSEAASQGINLRRVIKHNNIIPREIAAKLQPNNSLFRPVQPHERFAAALDAAMEQYSARRASSSPGQLGLWHDEFTGSELRSGKTQQRIDWDESKHPRDAEGKFTDKGAGVSGAAPKKPKKPFVYPSGETQAFDETGKPSGEPEALGPSGLPPEPTDLPPVPSELAPEAGKATTESESPRDSAERGQKELDPDYEFARASAIPNAGEDLKGSARHVRNHWRSLEDAEREGTAAELVTRDNLLKNEPHQLGLYAEENPLTVLIMHQALKSFPTAPGYGRGRKVDAETAKKDRSDYLNAYRNIKKAAEQIAASGQDDPMEASRALGRAVKTEIDRLRSGAYANRYNNTANALINLANSLNLPHRGKSIVVKTGEFAMQLKGENSAETRERLIDATHQILEGKTFGQVLGTKGKAREREFSPADLYVGIAERNGGPDLPAKDAREALDYLVDEVGLRGVQFGNSVSDAEREHHAKMAAGALLDLASVMGLPVAAISLDGKLGLAMGARGKGNALAHYEPGTKVINLTRKNGVGSLAHEWAHALDHHMGGGGIEQTIQRGRLVSVATFQSEKHGVTYSGRNVDGKWVSNKEDRTGEPIFKEMQGLRDAMISSGFSGRMGAAIKDAGETKKSEYWRSQPEMFARCFERYVQRKLENQGRKNTYLAGIDSKAYKSEGLWPTDKEVEAMTPAFDALVDAYREHRVGVKERVKYSAFDREAYVDRLTALMLGLTVEQYAARKLKSSPGQLGLFGDGLGGDQLRSSKTQKRIPWDESKHPRASDGRFGNKPGNHTPKQADKREPHEMIPRVGADAIGDGSNGTYDRMHAGLATEDVQSRIAAGMKGIEGREYAIFQHKNGKWQLVSRPAEQETKDSGSTSKVSGVDSWDQVPVEGTRPFENKVLQPLRTEVERLDNIAKNRMLGPRYAWEASGGPEKPVPGSAFLTKWRDAANAQGLNAEALIANHPEYQELLGRLNAHRNWGDEVIAGKKPEEPSQAAKATKPKTAAGKLLGKRGGDAKVLAAMLYDTIESKGQASLLGHEVKSAEDLASIAQVYRDPRFETFRAFFVKNGKIVGHNAYSSRLPGMVIIPPEMAQQIQGDMKSLEADGYYIMHNHPSGDPTPSSPDISTTIQFAKKIPGLIDHVIIDHNKGSIISSSGSVRSYDLPNEPLQDKAKATVPHDYLDHAITSTESLAELAMHNRPESGRAIVVMTNAKNRVRAMVDVSQEALGQSATKLAGAIRRAGRAAGAGGMRFLVLPDGSDAKKHKRLIEEGLFMDIIGSSESYPLRMRHAIDMKPDPIEAKAKSMTTARERYSSYSHGQFETIKQAHRARYLKTLDPTIEYYRVGVVPEKTKEKSDKSEVTTGTFGERGRFVTLDDGRVIFIKTDGTVGRGPRDLKGKRIDSTKGVERSRGVRSKTRDKFVPKTQLDRAIVETIGDHPDDVNSFRDFAGDAHKLLATERAEELDELRNVLAHYGYTGSRIGAFISKLKRSEGDYDSITAFDELARTARENAPRLLSGRIGQSDKRGDDESALWNRLQNGFPVIPAKHSEEVMTLAREMWENAMQDQITTKRTKRADKRVLENPDDPFSDYVPFSSVFADQVLQHYHAANA